MLVIIIVMTMNTYYSLYLGLHGCTDMYVVDVAVVVVCNMYITMKHSSWTYITIMY